MSILDVRHVSKHYAAHTALDDVSLSVERGRVFGLLGPNGAGKTSLIRIINCITAPDAGEVIFNGHPLRPEHVERIGYLPEERGLYRKMKVGEQAVYLARLKGLSRAEATRRLTTWFEKFEIMPWWDKKVEELSKGMQQKVQFVCTVLHEPELLIFDEPFSGFDPVNAELLKHEILTFKDRGHTIIFSTHNMQSVEEVCDDIALIDRSHLVLSGQVAQIRMDYAESNALIRLAGNVDEKAIQPLNPMSYEPSEMQTILRLPMEKGENLRDIVARIPQTMEILSIEKELPSMHDIFLKTVHHYGK